MTASPANRTFGQWKILLVAPDSGTEQEISPLIHTHLPYSNVIELREYPSKSELSNIIADQAPNLCLLDVDRRDWALPTLGDLTGLDTKLPIVALHQGNDAEYILKVLRGGATEFLVRPFTSDQFAQVMERIAAQHRSSRGGSTAKVYMVAPAKGACGASTVASSIAFLWQKFGSKRTLLADLDPYAGTISFQLKLKQNYSFLDALHCEALDDEIWKGLIFSTGNVDILFAPEQPVHGIDESHDPGRLVEYARQNYDTVVLDTGGVYGRWCTSLAHHSDDLLLVTTNELSALQATQRSLAYLDRARVERAKIRVVVNRFNRDFGLNEEVIEAALHADVVQVIPSDYDCIQKSLVDGKPVAQSSSVGKSLLNLASRLCGKPVAEAPDSKPAALTSLIGSLFGRR